VAVVEQKSADEGVRFLVGELAEEQGRSDGGVHPGVFAEQAEELEADGFAGLLVTGVDVEGRREGGFEEAVGMKGPEGKDVELLGGAMEVLAVEVGNLVDEGLGGFVGFHGGLRVLVISH
jgi:hypothetical protein